MATDNENPKNEREERLLEEAGKVFMTYGIKSVTMDDMAARLGISKKTLYQYVKDKNDLVEKVLMHTSDQRRCAICEVIGQQRNAIDVFFDVTTQVAANLKGIHPSIHFDLEKYHPEAFRKWREGQRKEIYETVVYNLESGIRGGLYREDINIPMIATVYIARFDMVFDAVLFPAERFNMPELLWEIFRYHIRGIASAKGLKYLEQKVKREMPPPAPAAKQHT
ncbi:MAG: TetR/AcrR family transcriptional regulator [Flavobacteriales bacterium]|nr:TetR/AcrR family transcriptional regulator [Flavobacteriales bacterium]MBP9080692.1 TetR/AcrR family transcriptional regulator [Flavobacteriales bacterium]